MPQRLNAGREGSASGEPETDVVMIVSMNICLAPFRCR
jgi:hypothetical protein